MKHTKLSSEQIIDIFRMKQNGARTCEICKVYSVDYGYVYRVISFFTGKHHPKTYFSKTIDDKIRLCEFVSEMIEDCGSIFRIVYILNRNGVFTPEDIADLDLKNLKYSYNIGEKTMNDLRELKGLPRLCNDKKSTLIFKIGADTGETKKRYGWRQIMTIQDFLDEFNSTRKDDEQIIIYEKR